MLSYEYGDAAGAAGERGGGNQPTLVLPKPLQEKREREAKMREDCAEIPQNILLKDEASMSSTSIREQLASLTLQAVCKRAEVRKNGRFEPFVHKHEHVAKTGTGQT
jgi:hypothetical protein